MKSETSKNRQKNEQDKKLFGEVLVTESDIMSQPGNFGDYKGKLSWMYGSSNPVYSNNTNGKHTAPNGSAYIKERYGARSRGNRERYQNADGNDELGKRI